MPKPVPPSISAAITRGLYSKAKVMVEAVHLQVASSLFEDLLNEADPKPRVEKDHRSLPVIPTKEQFQQYFERMTANHIQAQLATTHERWKEAVQQAQHDDSDFATAQVKAVETEIEAANDALNKLSTKAK